MLGMGSPLNMVLSITTLWSIGHELGQGFEFNLVADREYSLKGEIAWRRLSMIGAEVNIRCGIALKPLQCSFYLC
jgi:lactam utilization protein B